MIKAVIFDKDGVLIETFDLHAKAHLIVLSELGIKAKTEDIAKRYGKLTSHILKEVTHEYGKDITDIAAQELANKKEEIYRKMAEKKLKLLPGVKKMLIYLRKKDYKIGLASSSSRESIEQLLRVAKIKKIFDATISGWEIKTGKPDPEIFLKCAERLKIEPEECVVVEDSIHGIEAAKRAGMKCIAVATGQHSKSELEKLKPDLLLDSLEEFDKILDFLNSSS